MAIYEFFCSHCKKKFEALLSYKNCKSAKCPKCNKKTNKKLISKFAVGGQGDLRESTLHGCHDAEVSLNDGQNGHDHEE